MRGRVPYMESIDMDEFDRLLAANLPGTVFASRSDASNSGEGCSGLQTAISDQEETTASVCKLPNPTLKALQEHIQNKRKINGQPEIKPEVTPPKDYKLTPEEKAKKLKRKEQNRLAAQRCRQKKRSADIEIREKYKETKKKHEKLLSDRNKLHKFKTQLQKVLQFHLALCNIVAPNNQSPRLAPSAQQKQHQQKDQQLPPSTLPMDRMATGGNGLEHLAFDDIEYLATSVCGANPDGKLNGPLGAVPTTFPTDQDSGGLVLDSTELAAVFRSFQSQGDDVDSMLGLLNSGSGSDALRPPTSAATSAPSTVLDPNMNLSMPCNGQHIPDSFHIPIPTPTPLHNPTDATENIASEQNDPLPYPSAQPQSSIPFPLSSSLSSDAFHDVNPSRASLAPDPQALPDLPGYPFSQAKRKKSNDTSHEALEKRSKIRKTATVLPPRTSTTLPASASMTSTISVSDLQSVAGSSFNHLMSRELGSRSATFPPSLTPPATSPFGGFGHHPPTLPASSQPTVAPPSRGSTSALPTHRPALTPPPATSHHPLCYQRSTPSAPPDANYLAVPPPAQSPCLPLPSPVLEERDPHDDEGLMGLLNLQPVPTLPFGEVDCSNDSECLSSTSLFELIRNFVPSSQEE